MTPDVIVALANAASTARTILDAIVTDERAGADRIAEAREAIDEIDRALGPVTTSDHDAMLAIRELMDGVDWDSDTTSAIAEIMERAGYPIADSND